MQANLEGCVARFLTHDRLWVVSEWAWRVPANIDGKNAKQERGSLPDQ